MYIGVQCQYTVTISSNPPGLRVTGQSDAYDYPILSTVILTCSVTSSDETSITANSYQWNTVGCYTNSAYKNGRPSCFPNGQTTASVTGSDLTSEDAGTVTCIATVGGVDYTSTPWTLRVSG